MSKLNGICRVIKTSPKDEEMSLLFVAILVLKFIIKLRFPTTKSITYKSSIKCTGSAVPTW